MHTVDKPGEFTVGTLYQGYLVTAVMEAEYEGRVNGHLVYCMAGEDGNGNAVTWMLNFQPGYLDDSEAWVVSTYWGHYFYGDREVTYTDSVTGEKNTVKLTAGRRALYDLVNRVKLSPDILAVNAEK